MRQLLAIKDEEINDHRYWQQNAAAQLAKAKEDAVKEAKAHADTAKKLAKAQEDAAKAHEDAFKQLAQQQTHEFIEFIAKCGQVPETLRNVVFSEENTKMDFMQKFDKLVAKSDASLVFNPPNNHNHKPHKTGWISLKCPHNLNHQEIQNLPKMERTVNRDVELRWEEPVCARQHHYNGQGSHQGIFNQSNGCVGTGKWCRKSATGFIVGINGYCCSIVTAAHTFAEPVSTARNFHYSWSPTGEFVIIAPLNWCKVHPNYPKKTDPNFDIAVVIGEMNGLTPKIKSTMNKFPIAPFDIVFGPKSNAEDAQFYFDGFTNLLKRDGVSSLFKSKIHPTGDCAEYIPFAGGVCRGQSGAAIIQLNAKTNKKRVIAIQSCAVGNDEDFMEGEGCKMTVCKLNFLKTFVPCRYVCFECDDGGFVSFYD